MTRNKLIINVGLPAAFHFSPPVSVEILAGCPNGTRLYLKPYMRVRLPLLQWLNNGGGLVAAAATNSA
jgi:hypothetical protein